MGARTSTRGAIRPLLGEYARRRIVIDLSRLEFCDSSCIRYLVSVVTWSAGQRVTLRNPQPAVQRVLDIVDAGTMFDLEGWGPA